MRRPLDCVKGQTHTINPDLSSRGCRMMISNELLFRTLLRAILEAAKQRKIN